MGTTCLNRILQTFEECKNCKMDYKPITPTHPINNLSCPRYKGISAITAEEIYGNKDSKVNLEDIFQE